MDSVTHFLAGGLTPLIFKRAPRGAALVTIGIICGELPDIDVLAGSSAKAMLVIHRGLTHSFPALILFSLLMGLVSWLVLCRKSKKHAGYSVYAPCAPITIKTSGGTPSVLRQWNYPSLLLMCFIAISVHLYLDCMTTFGTRIFMPVSELRVSLPAMFIFDPFFTIPLLIFFILAVFRYKKTESIGKQLKVARIAFAWMLLYPLATFTLEQCISSNLAAKYGGNAMPGGTIEKITLTPEPFAPFIWRVVAEDSTHYSLATFYLLEPSATLEFKHIYTKPDPKLWASLQKAEPIFEAHAKFASFNTQSKKACPDSIQEIYHSRGIDTQGWQVIVYTDLRYVSTLERLMSTVGRDDGNFIMEILLTDDSKLAGWRYLSRGKAQDTLWTFYPEPLDLGLSGGAFAAVEKQ